MVPPAVVLFPLYIYPSTGAWNFVTQSITANPSLQFNIIVNPNSGPGAGAYPDSNYIAGLTALNSHSNVKLLGYVHTSYAQRPVSAIEHDISVYAGWTKYSGGKIHVSGIFFDEVNSAASKSVLSYMSTLATYTRNTLGAGRNTVVFNPGVQVDKAFYNSADTIIVWEDAYSPSKLTSAIAGTPQSLRKKSAFVLHNFSGTTTAQTLVVDKVASSGYGSLFITTAGYDVASKIWPSFCSSMTVAT